MIGIINYGLGNLYSVARAFERLGVSARIISTPREILEAEKLILPGVGHAGAGMAKLRELGLIPALNEKVLVQKTPILGLCLGMQLMAKHSEEGGTECLGWFDATVVRFTYDKLKEDGSTPILERRIPHMGWNSVAPKMEHSLLYGITPASEFYFAHSYFVKLANQEDMLGETIYQLPFASIIGRENIFGVQFHPERSHKDGLQLLKNFANLAN